MKKFFFINVLIGFIFLTVSLNLYASQKYNPIMYGLFDRNISSIMTFIKLYGTYYGKKAAREQASLIEKQMNIPILSIIAEEQKKENYYKYKLLHILKTKNPKSRDILIALSKIYAYEGNTLMSRLYLKNAILIDPFIKKGPAFQNIF